MYADRVRRTGRVRRTQVSRPAHRYLSGRGRFLHEAADLGDGGGARQESAPGSGVKLTRSTIIWITCDRQKVRFTANNGSHEWTTSKFIQRIISNVNYKLWSETKVTRH